MTGSARTVAEAGEENLWPRASALGEREGVAERFELLADGRVAGEVCTREMRPQPDDPDPPICFCRQRGSH